MMYQLFIWPTALLALLAFASSSLRLLVGLATEVLNDISNKTPWSMLIMRVSILGISLVATMGISYLLLVLIIQVVID